MASENARDIVQRTPRPRNIGTEAKTNSLFEIISTLVA